MRVIALACAYIPQCSRPYLDLRGVEYSDSSGLDSLLSPDTKSLVVIKFLKKLPADNESHTAGIDPGKERFSSRWAVCSEHLMSNISIENRAH